MFMRLQDPFIVCFHVANCVPILVDVECIGDSVYAGALLIMIDRIMCGTETD